MGRPTDDRTLSTADRRRFLTVLGALGVTGLAGCGGDGDGTDSPTDTDAGGNGNGDMTDTDTEMGGNGNGNGETPTESPEPTTEPPGETPTDTPEQPLGDSPAELLEIGGASLQPGGTTTLSGTLEHPYLFPVRNVEVTMTAPNDDWTIEATGDTTFDSIPTGGTEDVGWEVTAPDGADGDFTIEASVSYETTTDSADISLPVSVIVLAPGEAPVEGLQAYYPFDSDPPTDASENSNTPTNNGATFDETGGIDGGAFDFDGSDDYMNFPSVSADYSGSGDWTTSMWVNLDSLPSDDGSGAYAFWHPRADSDVWIGIDDGAGAVGGDNIIFNVYDGSNSAVNSGVTPSTGQWTHVAVVSDTSEAGGAGQYKIYVDGNKEGQTDLPAPSGTSDTNRIGAQQQFGRWYVDGRLDDLRMYDRALSESEIGSFVG
jgi:hypothetical protein